ncbi:hypothetical protein EV690_0490 [Celerinatantimonas diazotrophica]|uniref:AEC family transporter n=2 Tax=Celerinatantimonas diazotrophica TaxID=412034 RepID=A0A4R1KAN9_9GAMM|nr:AEC family transporter [Celerinatantimonas diazotrophica]TCK61492.1 hypothetical protein EV690_0490 [Celerinatantimonas diazotrophica]CAG9296955.1 hypothetical protein CEDIAZO_02117 [Celerinatantimonas diazotrophica]
MINQILVLFILMALGYGLAKYKVIDAHLSHKLTWLLCYVVMPCLILKAFQIPFSTEMLHNFGVMSVVTIAIHVVYIVLSKLLFNKHTLKDESLIAPMQFTSVYSNCGFMGIPLVAAINHSGVFYGSVYIAINGLFVWTHGLLTYTGKIDRKALLKVLLNPNTIVAVIGIIFFIGSVKLPVPIVSALGYIGSMNTALSMIVVGAAMTQVDLKKIFVNGMAWVITLVRNLLFPSIVLIGLTMAGINSQLLVILLVLSACPVAGMAVIFAQLTGRNTVFPCISLALSTIMSMVSIPVLLALAAMIN